MSDDNTHYNGIHHNNIDQTNIHQTAPRGGVLRAAIYLSLPKASARALDKQRWRCEARASELPVMVVMEFIDAPARPNAFEPDMRKAIAALEKGDIQALICTEDFRLSRDPKMLQYIMRQITNARGCLLLAGPLTSAGWPSIFGQAAAPHPPASRNPPASLDAAVPACTWPEHDGPTAKPDACRWGGTDWELYDLAAYQVAELAANPKPDLAADLKDIDGSDNWLEEWLEEIFG